jgi:hypothetical protein
MLAVDRDERSGGEMRWHSAPIRQLCFFFQTDSTSPQTICLWDFRDQHGLYVWTMSFVSARASPIATRSTSL